VVSLALAFAVAVVVVGCGPKPEPSPIVMAWPEPPDPPRVVFVRTLTGDLDVKQRSGAAVFLDALIGRRYQGQTMFAPLAVAATDDGGRLYVADYSQGLVYCFDFASSDFALLGENGSLGRPAGLAIDTAQNLYVDDQQSRRITVFDADGKPLRTIPLDETIRPTGIAIDRARGLLYVADPSTAESADHFVRVYDLAGHFIRNVGQGRGTALGKLQFPTYVALDTSGNVYVSETVNSRVSAFDPQGNFLRAFGGMGDRPGQMNRPKGVATDSFGNVYVVDSAWSVVQIFSQKGDSLLFFGGRHRYPGMMENPSGIAIDSKNRIYVADTFNHRVNIYDLVNTKADDSRPPASEPKKPEKSEG
jgi:DNA-binding beta-propeller fold protein YncE